MADFETVHKIVEKFEIEGGEKLASIFDILSKGATEFSQGMNGLPKLVGDLQKKLDGLEQAASKEAESKEKHTKKTKDAAEATGFFSGSILKNVAAVRIASSAYDLVVGTLKNFVLSSWETNVQVEAMGSRVQGLYLALADLSSVPVGDRITTSTKVANATLSEFNRIALRTATMPAQIESGFARIVPTIMAMGQSQKDALGWVEKSTAAAKVYGEDAGTAGGIVAKALAQGVVEGESAFAVAFKGMTKLQSTMSMEERVKRVGAALEQLGGPVDAVTQDTAGMKDRMEILGKDIMQRIVLPAYTTFGTVLGVAYEWFRKNEESVDRFVTQSAEMVQNIITFGQGIWEAVAGFMSMEGPMQQAQARLDILWTAIRGIGKILDLTGHALRTIGALFDSISDPGKGLAKFYALAEGLEIKFLKIQNMVLSMVNTFSKIVLPESLREYAPDGLLQVLDQMQELERDMDRSILDREKKLDVREQALGLAPSTEFGRERAKVEMGLGMDKAARDALLDGIKGKKPIVQVDIAKVEIAQNFRDADPDRILLEFVHDLERLSESAIQSTVGGGAMVFGPGGG